MNIQEALELAIKEETTALKLYNQLANQVEDPETRLMLEQIAREEAGHIRIISERLKAIKLLG